jgi:catechol 2,3-dioxygenase-like lactoylglutathione lyase family enzyme
MADGMADAVPRVEAHMTEPFEAGVVVRDLERMARFYRDVLGCPEVHRSRIPASIGTPAGLGGELLVVWLQVPSGGRVKLIRPQSAPAPAGLAVPLTARRGLAYLTFHFRDMDPVVAALAAGGAWPRSPDQLLGRSGGQCARTRRPARRRSRAGSVRGVVIRGSLQ